MSLRIIYKKRERSRPRGGQPKRPEPSKPGRGHKYATPRVPAHNTRRPKGQRAIIPDARRSGLVSFWHGEGSPGVLLDSHGRFGTGGFRGFSMSSIGALLPIAL